MTRWKKQIRTKGFKLETDFPMIPFECGSQSILGVYTNLLSDGIQVLTEYNSLVTEALIDRAGNVEFNTL